jgi:hypothetical protein
MTMDEFNESLGNLGMAEGFQEFLGEPEGFESVIIGLIENN